MLASPPAPLTLPRLSWGDPASERRALLVHGLGSNGALMWRFGVALAGEGWHAEAVDLRGHGTAPRALDYSIRAYAADLQVTRPHHGLGWDLVVAHSLGGAAATAVAASDHGWTERLVLIDPAIHLAPRDREIVRTSQERAFADPTIQAVRAEHPQWHPHDVELKALSAQQASRWAVEQTSVQNAAWDVRDAASRLTVPTHIIGSDPKVYSIFTGRLAQQVLANPAVAMSVVAGAGHSPHRDKPEATIAEFLSVIGD
jgi:pimeloyl-ACP methyl ester carboxylesterase